MKPIAVLLFFVVYGCVTVDVPVDMRPLNDISNDAMVEYYRCFLENNKNDLKITKVCAQPLQKKLLMRVKSLTSAERVFLTLSTAVRRANVHEEKGPKSANHLTMLCFLKDDARTFNLSTQVSPGDLIIVKPGDMIGVFKPQSIVFKDGKMILKEEAKNQPAYGDTFAFDGCTVEKVITENN